MALTQSIPRNARSASDLEADAVLALHNRSTAGRQVQRGVRVLTGTELGETAGTKVAGSVSISGGSV